MANINDQIINGGDLMLFIDGKSIAFATNHTLSISAETAETSSKDTGGMWVAKAIRKISWTMSTENLYAETGEGATYDELFQAMVGKKTIEAVIAIESNSADLSNGKLGEVPEGGWTTSTTVEGENKLAHTQYSGTVVCTSLELNAPNGDNATYTATFEGVGELKRTAVSA